MLLSAAAHILLRCLGGIVWLATLVPTLAASARRLHDTNKSGWWQLICFVPVGGTIVLLVLCALPPVEPNRYG